MIKYLLFFAIIFNAIATEKIKDNELKIGKADNQDVKITANNGAANQPYLLYDWSAGTWKQSNDGLTEQGIGGDSVLTTDGDILYYNSGEQRLPKGTDGQFLNLSAGLPAWTTIVTSPITTEGDLQIGDASGDPVRLPIGSATRLLTSNGTTASWELPKDNSVNYFTNPTIEENADDFIVFDDAAFPPIDGTGGSPTVTATRSTTSGTYTPVRETASLLFTKPSGADYTGEGFSTDISVDKGFQGNMATGSVWVLANDTDCVDDAVKITIYDITNTTMERSVSNEGIKCNSLPYIHYFQFPTTSNSTEYRVTFTYDSTDTNEVLYYFDDFKVGVTNISVGTVSHDEKEYTLTTSWDANATYSDTFYYRVGNKLYFKGKITLGSAPSGNLTVTLPNGLSIDDDVEDTATLESDFGSVVIRDNSSLRLVGRVVGNASTTSFRLAAIDSTGTVADSLTQISNSSPFTFASGDVIEFKAKVAIDGWGNTAGLSSDLGAQDVSAKYRKGSGSLANNSTEILDFDDKVRDLTNSTTTGASWRYDVTQSGRYKVFAKIALGDFTSWDLSENARLSIYKNGVFETELDREEAKTSDSTASGTRITLSGGDTLDLVVGDYIDIRAYQNTGSSVAFVGSEAYNYVTIDKDASSQTILDDSYEECQTKFLSADVGTITTVSDLAFNNIRVGKCHSLHLHARGEVASDNAQVLNMTNGSRIVAASVMGNQNASTIVATTSQTNKFIATATTITAATTSIGGGNLFLGDGGVTNSTETYATLCELPASTKCDSNKFD